MESLDCLVNTLVEKNVQEIVPGENIRTHESFQSLQVYTSLSNTILCDPQAHDE